MKTIGFLLLFFAGSQYVHSQKNLSDGNSDFKKNYLSTSLFSLASLIPDDNTYFFELDFGRKLNEKSDLILGANIYQYTLPMSSPWSSEVNYPGHVVSGGIVFAYQYYIWKNLFVDQMINPLLLNYYPGSTGEKSASGFMLLMATRLGYHLDFTMLKSDFFLEIGAEVSYWPMNTNVPANFKVLDDQYSSFVFSPALQFGYKF